MSKLTKGDLVYVAGSYTPTNAKTNHDHVRFTQWNVDKAIDVGIRLIRLRFVAVIPHLSHYIQLRMAEDFAEGWYDYDNRLLDACNAILMMDNWRESKGATAEYYRAKNNGQIILHMNDLVEMEKK